MKYTWLLKTRYNNLCSMPIKKKNKGEDKRMNEAKMPLKALSQKAKRDLSEKVVISSFVDNH